MILRGFHIFTAIAAHAFRRLFNAARQAGQMIAAMKNKVPIAERDFDRFGRNVIFMYAR